VASPPLPPEAVVHELNSYKKTKFHAFTWFLVSFLQNTNVRDATQEIVQKFTFIAIITIIWKYNVTTVVTFFQVPFWQDTIQAFTTATFITIFAKECKIKLLETYGLAVIRVSAGSSQRLELFLAKKSIDNARVSVSCRSHGEFSFPVHQVPTRGSKVIKWGEH